MARHLDKPRPGTRWRVAAAAAVLVVFGSVAAVGQNPQSDRDLLISIHQQLHAAGIPDSPTSTSTSTSTTTPTTSSSTSSTTSTTAQLTPVDISVTVFNGNRARVSVVPNNGATVVIRSPSGVVVSRGASGDVPAQYCCSPGTYTWVAEVNPGFVASPGSGSFTVVAPPTTTSTSTTTTVPGSTTTTTVPSGGESYVNPSNTGAGSGLGTYSGSLTITTNQTIENVVVRGEVRVCGNVTVTFRNVRWEPTSTNAGGRAFQVDGSNGGGCSGTSPLLILDHVTIAGGGQIQRGVSSQRGGVAQVHFSDISGVEDCMNTQGGSSSRRNIMADSYCHDLDSPASSPHHDGYQIMGGYTLIERSVILVPNSATAAIFPKSDAGSITATFRENYLNGGTYTARRCEGSATTIWTNNEIGPDHQFGAVLGPQGGCTTTVTGESQVSYRPGGAGWHPGAQS